MNPLIYWVCLDFTAFFNLKTDFSSYVKINTQSSGLKFVKDKIITKNLILEIINKIQADFSVLKGDFSLNYKINVFKLEKIVYLAIELETRIM